MKKIISLFVFLMLLSFFSQAQIPKNDWEEMKLKGKVKLLSKNYFKVVEKNGIIEKGEKTGREIETFNKNGNRIESVFYEADGSFNNKTIWKYDARGSKIEKSWYISEKILEKETYIYDSSGNCIEKSVYDSTGAISYKTEYQYNNDQKMVQSSEFPRGGNLRSKAIYKYDSKGNKIETNHYKATGELSGRTIYKNDEKGNPIETEYHRDLLLEGKFKNMYKSTRKLNENGDLIEVNDYDTEKVSQPKRTCRYKYDKSLNWIKLIEFVDGVPKAITERKIVYF